MSLEWHGEQLKRATKVAAKLGVDQTTTAAVRAAKNRLQPGHGYQFGVLKRSVQSRAAREIAPNVIGGLWGSFDVAYAIYVETGTAPHWIGSPVKIKGVGWRFIGLHPGTQPIPYLRVSADEEYPKLAGRIQKALAT